jgi:hypothetical protein
VTGRAGKAFVEAWDADLRASFPSGGSSTIIHTSVAIDGTNGLYGSSGMLERTDSRRVRLLMDERSGPAFSVPNDRTLAHAERSGGRLIPLVRLDLTARPIEEARRCLDLGARGIKLHPRAQAFALDDERLGPVFELAVERSVPILIHGGRGLLPIAEHLERLVRRYDGVRLIVAHAGIADMAGLAGRLGGMPGVLFDTSVWSGVDLLDLYRQVTRAGRLRVRLPVRLAAELAAPCGRTAKLAASTTAAAADARGRRRIAKGELEPLSSPRGHSLVQPLTFARIRSTSRWRSRCSGCASGMPSELRSRWNASRRATGTATSRRIEALLSTGELCGQRAIVPMTSESHDAAWRTSREPRGPDHDQDAGVALTDAAAKDARCVPERPFRARGQPVTELRRAPTRSQVVELRAPPGSAVAMILAQGEPQPLAASPRGADLAGVNTGRISSPRDGATLGSQRANGQMQGRRRRRGTVACSVDLLPRSGRARTNRRAMRRGRPGGITERRPSQSTDQIGEENRRENAIGRPGRTHAREELLDLVEDLVRRCRHVVVAGQLDEACAWIRDAM